MSDLEETIAAEMTPDDDAPAAVEVPAAVEEESEALAAFEPEPDTQPSSEVLSEDVGKKLDGVQKYVTRRLGEILGEDATGLTPCFVCSYYNMPGWLPPVELPGEVKAAMSLILGQRDAGEYAKDDYSRACDKCNGLGDTMTGSKVKGQDRLPCIDCKARGWIAVGPERDTSAMFGPNGAHSHGSPSGDSAAPMFANQPEDSPEIAALKALGYVVIPPFVTTG